MNVYGLAAKYIGGARRTEADIRRYLKGKGFKGKELEDVIETFRQDGYLNDRLYSQDYFRYAYAKGWASRRTYRELERKGISREDAEGGFSDYTAEENPDEEACALRVVRKAALRRDFDDDGRIAESAKARLARRLYHYGYETAAIYKTLAELEREKRREAEAEEQEEEHGQGEQNL